MQEERKIITKKEALNLIKNDETVSNVLGKDGCKSSITDDGVITIYESDIKKVDALTSLFNLFADVTIEDDGIIDIANHTGEDDSIVIRIV